MSVTKIISGGQTGADQGGLEAGKALGLETGGWAPRGWRTEVGASPWLAEFGLKEYPAWSYPPRTKANVRSSDGTVVFGEAWSPGSRLTINICDQLHKPCIHFDHSESAKFLSIFKQWIDREGIKVLNVAGNRESKHPGIQQWVKDFLIRALKD